ncbi:NAD(P)-dependent oxidoreductase [Tabrizicola flagellatus]|uniref:NAD(P)-dependent oxidoreductase n=1 Tax=Tabrizicola flagellatus TaxID=2593021 RepID=UPI00135A4559|nr:NAD(P)H-binding protein [Tabrizicola flagellatus]
MKLLILGATGTIGRELVQGALERGHAVTAQTRQGQPGFPAGVMPAVFDPASTPDLCCPHLRGQDAVIYALGFRGRAPVRFFSETTCRLLAAMQATGVRRLVAITGVGAGETKGHGGFLYEHLIFPFFTQAIYADKDRQEDLIRASDTDWTILRPAPFKSSPGREPFHVLTEVRSGTRLARVTPLEVARMALDCAEKGLHRGEAVFFGHGVAG